MGEAVPTDDLVEVKHSRSLGSVAKRCEGAVELALERLPFAGPRGGADVLETPLDDQLCEPGEREVVQIQIPSNGKLRGAGSA